MPLHCRLNFEGYQRASPVKKFDGALAPRDGTMIFQPGAKAEWLLSVWFRTKNKTYIRSVYPL